MNEILATIGTTDITKHIVKGTYEIGTEPVYAGSWEDGNFREHRVKVRDRIIGKFDVIFFDNDNGAFQSFLRTMNNATRNHLTTMGLYVENKASFQALQAYIQITPVQHAECDDGRMVNKMTLKIEEY